MTSLKIVLLLVSAVLFSAGFSQKANNSITIGNKETLYSKVLNEKREVWIHVPGNVTKKQTTKRYPVVYVLDGDANFHSITGMIREFSAEHGNTITPEMIVVGILNTDRTRDLTITHKTTGFGVDPEFAKNSGGGEKFTSFIKKELIPHIDSLYPTTPYRTLVGHSLGGVLVVNTLLNHTEMFNSYIALDPSLWWDEQLLVKQAHTQLKQKKFADKSFFMAIANTMNSNIDTAEMRRDTTENSLAFRSQIYLADELSNNKENGLKWNFAYYKNESHPSIPLIGEYDAFHFIFDFHKFTSFGQLWDPAFNADSALSAHYQNVSNYMSYTVLPPEDFLNGLGHAYLETAMLDKAEGVFKLNVKNYPASASVYTAMGDLYAAKGDNKTSASWYQKSLAIKNDPQLRKKAQGLAMKK